MATGRLVSKTRRIESLPLHLLKRGRIHLLPVYYLARLSRLGSELVSNQGSAEYQDLVYRNQPQGKLLIGKVFDRYLLSFPTARGCRSRLAATQETLEQLLATRNTSNTVILDLGCGYARGLIALNERINSRRNGQVSVYGMDLNDKAIETASARAKEKGLANMAFSSGDALNPGDYPVRSADIVVLNGLAQYLPRDERMLLYRNVHAVLNENGFLLTDYFCNWAKNPVQKWWKGMSEQFLGVRLDWLSKDEVEAMFSELPFRNCRTWYSHDRLCLMILAQK
ncbi:MAG: methyltransferase domain-containing protein [Chloroflexi bacterium]|nr:methyltransferase domain-containing protein [Chloroflexota bacterium]